MRPIQMLLVTMSTATCASANPADAALVMALRDVESYAFASCLARQAEPYLRDQGDGWASAIIQRAKGDLDVLTRVSEDVEREIPKSTMAVVRSELEPGKDKRLPIFYCKELIERPALRAAIVKAASKLRSAYRR
jgi:hypothetical protein